MISGDDRIEAVRVEFEDQHRHLADVLERMGELAHHVSPSRVAEAA